MSESVGLRLVGIKIEDGAIGQTLSLNPLGQAVMARFAVSEGRGVSVASPEPDPMAMSSGRGSRALSLIG
ncbi:MAG TPA: hypothetical protein VF834_25660 [Streptosporangiaceae bacterium]